MRDNRRHKRITVEAMDINGKMTLASSVKVHDISMSGVALMADRRFEIGREYSLTIELRGKNLSLNGIVVWSVLSELRAGLRGEMIPIYKAGIKFTDVTAEGAVELTNFIEGQMPRELHKPSGYRQNQRTLPDVPQKSTKKFPETYEGKKISLRGITIESRHELEIENRLHMEIFLTGNKAVNFLGKVAFCLMTVAGNEVRYDIGIEFLDMTQKDREKLKEFIAMSDPTDGDLSFFVRRRWAVEK